MRIGLEEGGHTDHDAWRTEPALQSMMRTHRLHKRRELSIRSKTLNGGYGLSIGLHRQHDARAHRFTVQQNGTSPTHSLLTADMGTRQFEFLTQAVGEGETRLNQQFIIDAVHGQRDTLFIGHVPPPLATCLPQEVSNPRWGE